MSKRLQVLLPDDEYSKFKQKARQAKVSLGEWVRSALRRVSDGESVHSIDARLALIRHGYSLEGPTDDIETIEKQIFSGYLK